MREMQPDVLARRQARVVDKLTSEGLDALLVTHLPNIRYLFNFTGSTALALITLEASHLIVDSRYLTQAKQETSGGRVILSTRSNEEALVKLVAKLQLATLGFEARHLAYSSYHYLHDKLPSIKLLPSYFFVEEIRIVKDPFEVEKLRKALELTWETFNDMIPLVNVGVREKDLAIELEHRLLRAGAAKLSFDTIVASGYRSAMPHGKASPKKIEKNEFVTFDFGVYLDGYASDMTRTVFVGRPKRRERIIYQTVLDAMQRAIDGVKPGLTGRRIDQFARDHIGKAGFGKFFGHGTGHGIGLEVHELPFISKRGKSKVRQGMAFTIEPGIYIPDLGGVRIEDVVVVTESGCEVLTKYPKELVLI